MTTRNPADDAEWTRAMAALEDELGPIVPGGAQGGVVARERRKRAAAAALASAGAGPGICRPSAAARARKRVRRVFQAVEAGERDAA